MYEQELRDLAASIWANPYPSECPCRGSGWFLSDFDSWYECPVHGDGVPHPEDEEAVFDHEAHRIRVLRAAWRYAQERSSLGRMAFRRAVEKEIAWQTDRKKIEAPRTPEQWVEIAKTVSDEMWRMAQDERAHEMGYSCRLEAAWAAEANVEARARACHMEPEHYAPRGSPERADADSWYR